MNQPSNENSLTCRPSQNQAALVKKHRSSSIRAVLTIALWVVAAVAPLFFFQSIQIDAYGFITSPYLEIIVGVIPACLTVVIWTVRRKNLVAFISLAVAVVVAGTLVANDIYTRSLFVDPDTYDMDAAYDMSRENLEKGSDAYAPFESTEIARLDEPSTLRFSVGQYLPKVDSATALLPLASSFVTAVYPRITTTIQDHDSDWDVGFREGYIQGFYESWRSAGYNVDKGKSASSEGSASNSVSNLLDLQEGEGSQELDGYLVGYKDGMRVGEASIEEGIKYDSDEYDARKGIFYAGSDSVFQYNNSTYGFSVLALGLTDVFFGTKADADQAQLAQSLGVEFTYTSIGRDGFVFMVNADNPVDSLTIDQVKDIYSGKITNWAQVGGNDAPIGAYQRNSNSGSQSMMERFMGDVPLAEAPEKLVEGSMGDIVRTLANYDNGLNAIGYSFRYYATDLVGDYNIKLLAIDGISPTAENISDESYPITSDFYAVTRKGDSNDELCAFLEWICGSQGQELVEKSGYAPIGTLQ